MKFLPAAAGLPDALVGLVPVVAQPVGELGELDPAGMADPQPTPVGQPDRVQQLTVDVELELIGGAVADADRLGAGVALPVVQGLLVQVGGAVDPVHDLQRPRPLSLAACSSARSLSQRTKASASSVNPRPNRAWTEKEPSRIQVKR